MPHTVLSDIESLLQDSSLCSHELGGLEFYGFSKEFRELLQLCNDFATAVSAERELPQKAYVFLDEYHGKSSLAKAIAIQTEANGDKVFRFDGTIGSTSRDLKDLQKSEDALIIIDDLPEAAANRSTVLERINSLRGRAVLLARPEYANDATLRPDITTIRMAHVDERHIDKVAWLVGLVREQVRDEGGVISEALANVITRLPVNLLATLCSVRLGRRVAELESLARKMAQAIQLSEALRPGNPLPDEELAAVFAEFYSAGADKTDSRFRLWVEGESDCRMLKLVCLLALPVYGLDLGEGLAIILSERAAMGVRARLQRLWYG